MDSLFKFGQRVPAIFRFQGFKKEAFFKQDLDETYISRTVIKIIFLMLLICNCLGINTNELAKNYPNFENKGLFQANIYRA